MIAPLHNWKDKLKNLILKYPKTTTGVLVVVLALVIFVSMTQGVSADVESVPIVGDVVKGAKWVGSKITGIASAAGDTILAGLIFITCLILYYVFIVPIFWLVAIVIQIVVEVASWQLFINEPSVIAGWTIARDLVNVGFIAVLLYISFGTVIGYKKVNWQKDLVKLIAAVVLVNFSRMIVGVLIDLSQVIMLTFVNGFRNVAAGNVTTVLGLDYYLEGTTDWDSDPSVAANNFVRLSLGITMGLLLLAILTMMAAWLLLRIVKLWLLIVMAPFYFLSNFFPFLNRFRSFWEKEFTDQLVAGPFMAFGIWFAMSVISQTGNPDAITTPRSMSADANALTGTVNDGSVAQQSSGLFTMLMGAGLLYGVFNMSKSMAGEAAIVGTKVWEKGKATTIKAATDIAKAADWTASQIGQRTIGVDTSVGGAKRYVDTKKEQFQEWKTGVENKSTSIAERRGKFVSNLFKSPEERARDSKQALLSTMQKQEAKSGMVKMSNGETPEQALDKMKKEGDSAANVYGALKNKNTEDAKKALADPNNKFSDDLKKKLEAEVAKTESQNAWGNLNNNTKGDISSRLNNDFIKFDQAHVQELQKGVLTQEEAGLLNGKSLADLRQSNPEMASKIEAKLKSASSGGGIDQALQQELMNMQTKGKKADTILSKWNTGKLTDPGLIADAKQLGLEDKAVDFMGKTSLTDFNKDRADAKAEIGALEKEVEDLVKKAEPKERKRQSDYQKSTSVRARSKRLGELSSKMRQIYKNQNPLLNTVAEQADRFLSTDDSEFRDYIISELKPEDAHEFLQRTGKSSDVTGYYELIAKIGIGSDKLDGDDKKNVPRILDELRTKGSISGEDEVKLGTALEKVMKDPYLAEVIQSLENKLKREVPGVKYATRQNAAGKYELTPLVERQMAELDDLLKRAISPEKFDGFVYKQDDGQYELSDVGFNYFQEAYGRIEKKMQDFNDDYVKALVKNKEAILEQARGSQADKDNMKTVLDKLATYTSSGMQRGNTVQKFARSQQQNQTTGNP
jgi:hypothetical protein